MCTNTSMKFGHVGTSEFIKTAGFFDYDANTLPSPEIITNIPRTTEAMQNVQQEAKASDYLVSFATGTQSYCVGLVDMVNSTKIAAQIGPKKISRYYQLFLNSMSKIVSRFGGTVIKNIGDCLVYYFPESVDGKKKFGLMACIECSLAMGEARNIICQKLFSEGLPSIDYRISADFGEIIIMKSNNTDSLDMIGPPLNMCSKINHAAGRNECVVGGDLYQMVKSFTEYQFSEQKGFSLGFKQAYPIYAVKRKCPSGKFF